MLYRTCPFCGAHLDPDERCDCQESTIKVVIPIVPGPKPRTSKSAVAETKKAAKRVYRYNWSDPLCW